MTEPTDKVRKIMTELQPVDMGPVPVAGLDSFVSIESVAAGNVRPTVSPDNVTTLRPDHQELRPRAKFIFGSLLRADEIEPQLNAPYSVKGWLYLNSIALLSGASNGGKSFLGLDIAHHVSKGQSWAGRLVRKGNVLYVAAEGGGGFHNRVSALDQPQFDILTIPITLVGPQSQAIPVSEVLQHLAKVRGVSFDLIIVDTLARVMGELEENQTKDISELMRNLDLIRAASGACVCLIHHLGKDESKGSRGSSALRAAVETEIILKRDEIDKTITAEVTKQRDGPTGYKFRYRLRVVELGQDQDGDEVTTCRVEQVDGPVEARANLADAARRTLQILQRLIGEQGEIVRKPEYPGSACVPVSVWAEECAAQGAISDSADPENRRRAWRKQRDALVDSCSICIRDDLVWEVVR
jgi:hypothetical protein